MLITSVFNFDVEVAISEYQGNQQGLNLKRTWPTGVWFMLIWRKIKRL